MDLLPTLLGALPDLGVAGVVLVVMVVGKRLLDSERAYFTSERATIRQEAKEDRAEARQEIRELKAENRELETLLGSERERRLGSGAPTVQFPAARPPP